MDCPYIKARFYRTQYEEAEKLFDNDDFSESIKAAQYSLTGTFRVSTAKPNANSTDPNLPPYHIIKNHILIASALEEWAEADVHRLAAVRTPAWVQYTLGRER